MTVPASSSRTLAISDGEYPLHEYHLHLAGREWRVLHTGVILTYADEARFLREQRQHVPYGVALWPSAIALAHDLALRGQSLVGRTVLELGAGTGLPGIVAAAVGARVVQTDRHELAMSVCRRNGTENGVAGIEHRLADWGAWQDAARYDWIIGSDILYTEALHPQLRGIFESNLAPAGRVLLSDPFRNVGFRLLEKLEQEGWSVSMTKWQLGEQDDPRPIGVFELQPPAP